MKKKAKQLYKHLTCPIGSAIIQLVVIFTVFLYIIPSQSNQYYSYSVNESKISQKISESVEKCGEGYFLSWLVLKTDGYKDKYFFKDVIGCNKENNLNCSFSVKSLGLNTYYDAEHIVDLTTYNFLNNLLTGEIATFSKKEDVTKYASINAAYENTNLPLKNLVLTVVKNIQENIVYVFTFSETGENGNCSIQDRAIILKDLALFARKRL